MNTENQLKMICSLQLPLLEGHTEASEEQDMFQNLIAKVCENKNGMLMTHLQLFIGAQLKLAATILGDDNMEEFMDGAMICCHDHVICEMEPMGSTH